MDRASLCRRPLCAVRFHRLHHLSSPAAVVVDTQTILHAERLAAADRPPP